MRPFYAPGCTQLLDWKKPEDYEKCKELFNRILYYGKYKTWCKDHGLPNIEPPIFITFNSIIR